MAFHTGMFCLCTVLYDLMLAGSRQTNITLAWTQPLIIKGIQGSCKIDTGRRASTDVSPMNAGLGEQATAMRSRADRASQLAGSAHSESH